MKIFLLILSFILSCRLGFSQGSDHLVPVEGYFHSFVNSEVLETYYERTQETLFKGIGENQYFVRVVILPSFQPEKLLSVESQEEGLVLLKRTVDIPIWAYVSPHVSSPNRELKLIEQKVRISEEIATELKELFLIALYKTQYPEAPQMGLDGTSYYFITHKQWAGTMAGKVWSPNKGTKMYELVELTELMEKLTQSTAPEEDQKSMIEAIKALKNKLQKD
ncbi:hypothetical protein H9Q13_10440 [Pontibacter sp. JH31]|uniref:Lipoprotein n=1 Tax=Pontibacter aquaedesilientis TaxID=2766980 RepID=A0ABR7XH19_9BACT|nr:hypothetical protein [Pontibacter aquaedesilientis]MBD1397585.1 hypothetical protein [Pontibacter aquaedesilientis]